jgi:hypothetical protein
MDLSEFQSVRSPSLTQPSGLLAGELDEPLLALLCDAEGPNATALNLLVTAFCSTHQDPRGVQPNSNSAMNSVLVVLAGMSDWLQARSDRVPGNDWGGEFDARARPIITRYGEPAWRYAFEESARVLSDWIYVGLIQRDLGMVADLTRWWTVRRMLRLSDRAAIPGEDTMRYLASRVPQLSGSLHLLIPRARVELVREASVADLYVVRSEWRQYVAGDLATVTNVLPGESHHHLTKHTSEEEITATSEQTTQTQMQTSTELEQQSELSQETATQLHAEINGYLRADVQQSWGTGSVKVSGGVEGRLSLDQSERQASRMARRAVTRAVSTVDNTTRESRIRRTLTRFEDTVDDTLANPTGKIVRGVYRWLDRIDRYQVFRYPDRLQLEFQLPEPAEYLRWLARERGKKDDTAAPPEWALENAEIKEDVGELLCLAAKYRATNLPTPPAMQVSVVQALKAEAKGEHTTPSKIEDTIALPLADEELELLVPPGYQATEITFSGIAAPAWGEWVGESADGTTWDKYHGWHGAVVSVLVGNQYFWSSNQVSGSPEHAHDAVHRTLGLDAAKTKFPPFGNAFVELNGGKDTEPIKAIFCPPATGKVKVALQGAGVSAAHIAVTMKCERTDETVHAWRQAVYDALFEAWSAWKRDWDADRGRAAEIALLSSGGSSTQVMQIIRDEIKRQVIAWLLGPASFHGMPGLQPAATGPDPSWRDIQYDAARSSAPTIEFLEQAFEWGSLNYMLYSYFWAEGARWDELQQVQHPNPDMERFLKAGSARVVVPARPAMIGAVQNWLIYQEPFFGRPLPIPGDPLFVSVAQEIRDLTEPPAGGEPGDCWETRVGTALLWLDASGDLPHNTAVTLGAAPHAPDPLLSTP